MPTISSTSERVVQSGGASATFSHMARAIRPFSQQRVETAAVKTMGLPPTGSTVPGAAALHSSEHPDTADLRDERVVGQGLAQALEQVGPDLPAVLHQSLALDDLQVRQGGRTAGRVVVVGEPAHEREALGRLVPDRLVDPAPKCDTPQREVTAGDPLGEGDQVRVDVPVLHPEPASGASEAGDHLVQDQQQAVAIANLPQEAEVLRGRHQDPTGSLDGLGDHGGDGLGSFPRITSSTSSAHRNSQSGRSFLNSQRKQ